MGERGAPLDFDGLAEARPSLPAAWYRDPAQFAREQAAIFRRSWICLGRVEGLREPGAFRTAAIAGDGVLLVRGEDGALRGFLNVCRHRGAELCAAREGRLARPVLACPYHQWTYRLTGELIATGPMRPVAGFERSAHGLLPVRTAERAGFAFATLDPDAPDFDAAHAADLAPLARWELESLEVGERWETELACDWKIFWENFNECAHCPGVHPALCALVPIYGRGIMARREHPDWRAHAGSDDPLWSGGLREGAESWTLDGRACGPPLPGLTAADRAAGQTYAVVLPSLFVVGHVDHARAVRVEPVGPGRTRLVAEWLFPAGTLAAPGFDLARVTAFAKQVMAEDAAACEGNQRGLATSGFAGGVLMQEEHEVAAFHDWVRARLGG